MVCNASFTCRVLSSALVLATGCTSAKRDFGAETQDTQALGDAGASATDAGSSSQAGSTGETRGEDSSQTADETSVDPASTRETPTSDGASTDTSDDAGTSGETTSEIDWEVGDPPNYEGLSPGEGRVLLVNTLGQGEVDVWLPGEAQPLLQGLEPEAARRRTLPAGAQRLVFTLAGTRRVVGCSPWFPLRNAEQWAVVATGGEHTCRDGEGSTLAFKQEQPLDANPVRYVHATTPDRFAVARNDQAEPGVLQPGETLKGTNLPNCSSGCEVRYRIAAEGIPTARYVTLRVATAEELPPAGEVLLLVLGNVREDWPSQPAALRVLRVDLDGTTYELRRDPEIAFARVGEGAASFSRVTPPTTTEILTVDPECGDEQCVLPTVNWSPGRQTFYVKAESGDGEITAEFAAGHRYLLLSTSDVAFPLFWLQADFDRTDSAAAYARAVNIDPYGKSLTLGYVFGDNAVVIESLSSIPTGEVSQGEAGGKVPSEENWRLVTGTGDGALGTGCFYSVDTQPGFRGYFVVDVGLQTLDVTAWPPVTRPSFMACF